MWQREDSHKVKAGHIHRCAYSLYSLLEEERGGECVDIAIDFDSLCFLLEERRGTSP
jgi:hypothetical protein